MTTWNLALSATLDRAPADDVAHAVARQAAGHDYDLLMVTVHDVRLGLRVLTDHDGIPALDELQDRTVAALGDAGFTVQQWEAAEALTLEETDRRLAAASAPPMVTATEFAELCGVTPKRIYELETERRKAAESGQPHPFPTPPVKGAWLRAAAERYAATRKRTPGPTPKGDTAGDGA